MLATLIDPLNLFLLTTLQMSILILESMALILILFYSCSTFHSLVVAKPKSFAKLDQRLIKGLSLGLSFYLAAEILETATIRSSKDFYLICLLILLRSLIAIYLQWSVRNYNTQLANCNG